MRSDGKDVLVKKPRRNLEADDRRNARTDTDQVSLITVSEGGGWGI
jgi:hypothetical protein